jgi:uncharacterized SAM-binding protein YcdF (DUF218 family)
MQSGIVQTRPSGILKLAALAMLGLGVLLLSFVEYLYRPLYQDQPPRPAQAIVVLSSSGYEAGIPNMRTFARLYRALQLYRDGYAPRIICLGGTYVQDSKQTIAQQMKQTLITFGVSAEHISVVDSTQDTYHDLSSLLQDKRYQLDFANVLFVTSSYHTTRVAAVLRKQGILNPIVLSAPFWERKPSHWGDRPDLLIEIAREYLAILYFWQKDWI